MRKLYYFYLAAAASLVCVVSSCVKDDYGTDKPWRRQSVERLTVAEAKKLFERETSVMLSRGGGHGTEPCGVGCDHDHASGAHNVNPERGMFYPGIMTPDWLNSEIVPEREVSKVVTPVNTQYRYVATRKEKTKDGKSKSYKSTVVQRMYVAKNSDGDNVVYVQVLVPDKGSRGEKNMPAELRGSKYSGLVFYYTVDGGFAWYYRYEGGKIVDEISIYDVNEENAVQKR